MTGEESLCAAAAALGPTESRLSVLKTVSTFALMAFVVLASWNPAAAQQASAPDPTESPSTPGAASAGAPAGTATPAAGGAPGQPAAASGETAPAADPSGSTADRTQLNLLGQVDSASGESRRNENVRLTLIDNNVLRELNTRMGTTATGPERCSGSQIPENSSIETAM